MKPTDGHRVRDIERSAETIRAYMHGMHRGMFDRDRKTQDAVLRQIELIGEAVKRLSPELKTALPKIPWKRIGGMRDKLAHKYWEVDRDLVWEVSRKHVRELATNLRKALRLHKHRKKTVRELDVEITKILAKRPFRKKVKP